MAAQIQNKYDEDFKKSLVSLHQNGKTQTQLCNEYGVSKSALSKWIKQYSTVETDDGQVLTSRQVKELQKRNAQQTQLCNEYGVSKSALSKWIKQYSTVETDDGQVLTSRQVKELQKRNAQLEEENLILKKAIAIFTPHSNND